MVNAFEPPQMDGIVYIPGRPRQYRGDCKAGAFKIGESKIVGKELKLEVLSFRTFEEQLFKYDRWRSIFVLLSGFFKYLSIHLSIGLKKIKIFSGINLPSIFINPFSRWMWGVSKDCSIVRLILY